MASSQHTNSLIHETSPYLLQHAHNPVNWVAWSEKIFEQAKTENKLVLISVGYSACHWCHVMEHESFEDETVASIMNEHFICVKIDREERPDVDSIYMTAVQLMTHQGGWPLNCFTLPDGRPVYGGTYFPKAAWIEVLKSLERVYREEKEKVLDYADKLTEAVRQSGLIKITTQPRPFQTAGLAAMVKKWSTGFDNKEGGPQRAPKFPLPNNYEFLLHYGYTRKDEAVLSHVQLTLSKMAQGGIYDQVGGGFSRYSVDELWKVPHFEKMLYDNGQLVSLYAKAWQVWKEPLFKNVVSQTLGFVNRELKSPEGGFYSALDADSEGEEGKFYVWKPSELEAVLTAEEFQLVRDYYNLNSHGYWEHENYILLKRESDEAFAQRTGCDINELSENIRAINRKLLAEREKRVRPGLDDKILTSWNGLMIKGFSDAYQVFKEDAYLQQALESAEFIHHNLSKTDGSLWHTYKNGVSRINGYLEDYCLIIEAWISLYQSTFDETWLLRAEKLMAYVTEHFSDENNIFFYFNSDDDMPLIARKAEIQDNVIPAGNSVMAKNLFLLGTYFYRGEWKDRAQKMLENAAGDMLTYGAGYSNWAQLYLWHCEPFHEIAIAGPEAKHFATAVQETYRPNLLVAVAVQSSQLPILKDKTEGDKTLGYVCHNKVCEKPAADLQELLRDLNSEK